ncbi:MAG: hypothetical protein E7514_07435 [Ruminococcaceae bacterium]|nr:hypothetical protein [Oscillospiraceae bacterium]
MKDLGSPSGILVPAEYFHHAEVIGVENTGRHNDEDWSWRKDYLGFEGALIVFKNNKKDSNAYYAHITNFNGGYLTTGYGEYQIENDILTIKTRNSIYKFQIFDDNFYFI